MAYFQVPWATKNGAIQTFGVEAAIVAGLFLLVVPTLQIKGSYLRVSSILILFMIPQVSHCHIQKRFSL